MQKILFVDIDGTLIDYKTNIPDSAIEAVREARKKGHKVYISTGRSKAEIYTNIWDIGFDGMIGGNGSYAEVNGNTILNQTITLEQCKRIVDWLHKRKLEFYLQSNNGLFASENFEERAAEAIKKYTMHHEEDPFGKIPFRKIFPEMIFGGNLFRDDLSKVSYILNSYEDFLDTKEQFPDLENGVFGGKNEVALFGDLGVKDITKAHAIEYLLKYIEAERKDTIAFGDAKADIPMLEYCQIGVAMGSGGKEIKEMADYVTDDVDKDGLYKAFKKLELI